MKLRVMMGHVEADAMRLSLLLGRQAYEAGPRLTRDANASASLHFTLAPPGDVMIHRLADALRHKPSRLVGNADRLMELVYGHRLFAGRQKEDRQQPFAEWNLAALEDGPDGDSEIFKAGVTLDQSGAMGLTLQTVNALLLPAVRTDGTLRPFQPFQMRASLVDIAEHGIADVKNCSILPCRNEGYWTLRNIYIYFHVSYILNLLNVYDHNFYSPNFSS